MSPAAAEPAAILMARAMALRRSSAVGRRCLASMASDGAAAGDASTSAAGSSARNAPVQAWKTFTVCPMDGSRSSVEAAIKTMQDMRPQQVFLETCAQRQLLASRHSQAQAAAAAAAQPADGSAPSAGASPLSHADAIAVVHGGLRAGDIVEVTSAADSIGAQVYAIDQPYQETQNRVARRLLLRPAELLSFIRRSASSLSGGDAATQDSLSIGLRDILEGDRERYMAVEVSRRAAAGADVLLVCHAARAVGLQRLLADGPAGARTAAAASSAQASRIWPFLLVLTYVLVPGYGSLFVAWRTSRWIAGFLPGPREITIPEKQAEAPSSGAAPAAAPPLGSGSAA